MAAEDVVGEKRGEHFSRLVAPQSKATVNAAFASKIVGARGETDYEAVLLRKDGTPVDVEICSIAVDGDAGIAGVFGAVEVKDRKPPPTKRRTTSELTPRQAEVLEYLSRGYKTDEMAVAMGLTLETVRNHVRGLLKRLGVHSRLEAVATGRMRGLV